MTQDQDKQTDGVPGAGPASQPGAGPASQPPAQQPPPGRGTNWPTIILGGVLIVVLIALVLLIIPQLGGEVADEAPAVTAPPATAPPEQVEVVIATREPRPTREQAEQPAQPPEGEAPPAESPPEQGQQQPPAESPPEQGQQPAEGDSASGLPVCSSLGLVGGLVVLGGVASSRKRRV